MKTKKAGRPHHEVFLLFYFLLGLFLVQSLQAGAWVHDKNKFYSEIGFGYSQAGQIFDRKGVKRNILLSPDPSNPLSFFSGPIPSTFKQYVSSAYIEYGLGYDLELLTSFPFYVISEQDSNVGAYAASGLGDMQVGLKYKFFERPWLILSPIFYLGVPTGNAKAQGKLSGKSPQPIALGDGEWDFAFSLAASRGFNSFPAYISSEFSYRVRTSGNGIDYTNDFPWSVDGGYTFSFDRNVFSSVLIFFAFRGLYNPGILSAGQTFLLSQSVTGNTPEQNFIDMQPGFSIDIFKKLSFFGTYARTLSGENTSAGWSVRTGISYQN